MAQSNMQGLSSFVVDYTWAPELGAPPPAVGDANGVSPAPLAAFQDVFPESSQLPVASLLIQPSCLLELDPEPCSPPEESHAVVAMDVVEAEDTGFTMLLASRQSPAPEPCCPEAYPTDNMDAFETEDTEDIIIESPSPQPRIEESPVAGSNKRSMPDPPLAPPPAEQSCQGTPELGTAPPPSSATESKRKKRRKNKPASVFVTMGQAVEAGKLWHGQPVKTTDFYRKTGVENSLKGKLIITADGHPCIEESKTGKHYRSPYAFLAEAHRRARAAVGAPPNKSRFSSAEFICFETTNGKLITWFDLKRQVAGSRLRAK